MVGRHVPDTAVITKVLPAQKNNLSRTDPGLDFHGKVWLPHHSRMPHLWEQHVSFQPGTQCLMCCTRRCWSMAVPIRKTLRLYEVSFKMLFIRANTMKTK